MDFIIIGEDCVLMLFDRLVGRRGFVGIVFFNKVKVIFLWMFDFKKLCCFEYLFFFLDMWCVCRGREKFRRNCGVWKMGYRKYGCIIIVLLYLKMNLIWIIFYKRVVSCIKCVYLIISIKLKCFDVDF